MKNKKFLKIKSLNQIKEVIEEETICGEKIYYMTDFTSYHESQVSDNLHEMVDCHLSRLSTDNILQERILNDWSDDCARKIIKYSKNH